MQIDPQPTANSISFLVAAYNMAPYITDMLNSISACMRNGDQLVIVDDGSADDTAKLCGHWLSTHRPDTIFIKQANRGVCASRNTALSHATGSYVLFLDGDDQLIHENFTHVRGVVAKHEPDVIEFDFMYWQPSDQPELTRSKAKGHPPQTMILDRSAILRTTLEDRAWALWGRLVRRSLVSDVDQSLFLETLSIDDVPVTPIILSRATSLFYLHEAIVKYRSTPNSLSRKRSAQLCLDIGASPAHALTRMDSSVLASMGQQSVHLWVARMFYEGLRMCLHSRECTATLFLELYQRAIQAIYPDPAPLIRSLNATGLGLDRKIAYELQRFARHPRLQSQLRGLSARFKRR